MPYYDVLQTITTGSDVGSISFSSIPQTYDVLEFKISARDTVSGNWAFMTMNINDNSGNWYTAMLSHYTSGNQNIAEPINNNRAFLGYISTPYIGGSWATGSLDIINYSSTSNKTYFVYEGGYGNGPGSGTNTLNRMTSTGRTSGDAAVSNVTFYASNGGSNFSAGTTITMYGLKKA